MPISKAEFDKLPEQAVRADSLRGKIYAMLKKDEAYNIEKEIAPKLKDVDAKKIKQACNNLRRDKKVLIRAGHIAVV